ncbi:MAG: hypothetical protein MJE68_06580 [Proteobacteria bacterium]|nr:hypothetical protein [Pseudomonadota bacterium]
MSPTPSSTYTTLVTLYFIVILGSYETYRHSSLQLPSGLQPYQDTGGRERGREEGREKER